MPLSEYQKSRLKFIEDGRPTPPKKIYKLNKVAPKTAAKIAAEKEQRFVVGGDVETEKQKWFGARKKEMIGVCQCGCGQKSSKMDAANYRSSISHIFPQRLFPTIQFHPLNWVERNFWMGCHGNMDNRSMDLWPNFADWDDIKQKFFVLEPLLTEKERSTKFFGKLAKLVQEN